MCRSALTVLALLLPVLGSAQDIPLAKILVEKKDWRKVAGTGQPISHLEGLPGGDIAVNFNGGHATLTTQGELLPGPGILLVRTPAFVSAGKTSYAIDKDGKSVDCFKGGKQLDRLKLKELKAPTCLALWPDEGHLVIGEADGAYVWAVRIEKDGRFGPGDRYYSLRTQANEKMPVAALIMDAGYLLYACTPLGIQVFDPTGRLSGVIPSPSKVQTLTAITIGGAKGDELFVAAGGGIYARHIQGKASYTLNKEK